MDDTALVVYVLDDDAAVREALARLMRATGFEVRACGSEEELLVAADLQRPGCVLFDLRMTLSTPLAGRLRGLGVKMPLIALTGDLDDAAAPDARRQGADFLFHKPVDARALVDAIRWVTYRVVH